MSAELTIITKESVQGITTLAPQAYSIGRQSHDMCLEAGQRLMERYNAEGMSDTLDAEMANYIAKSRKTVAKINELRSPVTKLFDEVRKVFTGLENEVDPAKTGSLPATIQGLRNTFAARKKAEEDARRREEEAKVRKSNALARYRSDVEKAYRKLYTSIVNKAVAELDGLNESITLENYVSNAQKIMDFDTSLVADWGSVIVYVPAELTRDEAIGIRQAVQRDIEPQLREQYRFEIMPLRDGLIQRLPSKKSELEAIAKAGAEEAERRRAEMEAAEKEESARRDEERRRKEAEEAAKAEAERKAAEAASLFNQAAVSAPSSKVSVRKRIHPLGPEAFQDIFAMWWAEQGQHMTVEELSKILRTQMSYCEKQANAANPVFIRSEHVEYTDEVKAR